MWRVGVREWLSQIDSDPTHIDRETAKGPIETRSLLSCASSFPTLTARLAWAIMVAKLVRVSSSYRQRDANMAQCANA